MPDVASDGSRVPNCLPMMTATNLGEKLTVLQDKLKVFVYTLIEKEYVIVTGYYGVSPTRNLTSKWCTFQETFFVFPYLSAVSHSLLQGILLSERDSQHLL